MGFCSVTGFKTECKWKGHFVAREVTSAIKENDIKKSWESNRDCMIRLQKKFNSYREELTEESDMKEYWMLVMEDLGYNIDSIKETEGIEDDSNQNEQQ